MKQCWQFLGLICAAGFLFNSGCSCSRIPESPPGPGVMSPVRHLNSGTTVPTTQANSNATPAPNTYVNPTPPPANNRPGYPQPVQPQPAPVTTQGSNLADAPPAGPRLKPSFPAESKK